METGEFKVITRRLHSWSPALGSVRLFTNQQEDLIESELKSNMKNSTGQDCPLPRVGSGG